MPNTLPHDVRKVFREDPRVTRSTSALGHALLELLQERELDAITVREIVARAGVGRTTFYAHYRSKEDVLHSSYERVFDSFESLLERSADGRLFPVREFLEHLADAAPALRALERARQFDAATAMLSGYATRMIARRMQRHEGRAVPAAALARMLAGALVEMVEWWRDHPAEASPTRMDAAFHAFARAVVGSTHGATPRT